MRTVASKFVSLDGVIYRRPRPARHRPGRKRAAGNGHEQ
jgi:hypothetical protein